jgi:HAD superfamily hydrolase (TIGR01490 family)
MDPTGAAFFDLDRTLIAENSGILYARHERANGRISRGQLARGLLWGGLYHLALVDIDKAFTQALAHYVGVSEREIADRTDTWFDADIAGRLLPGARAAIDQHRAAGQRVVLLTNSSSYAAIAAKRHWGLDDWLANVFNTDADGNLDGTMVQPLCYGAGKVVRAVAWAERHQVDLARSYFYTDSLTDLPMLERVGFPVAVQPDPRLRRVARKQGWPILDWTAAPHSAQSGQASA